MECKNQGCELVHSQCQYHVGENLLLIPFLVQSRASSISSKVHLSWLSSEGLNFIQHTCVVIDTELGTTSSSCLLC